MYEYCVEKEILYNSQLGRYTSYGISVFLVEEKFREKLDYFSDVFLDEKEVLPEWLIPINLQVIHREGHTVIGLRRVLV